MKILGVIKNFYWRSLKVAHHPVVLWPVRVDASRVTAHIVSDIPNTISKAEKIFKEYFPGNPFIFYFLDDFYNKMYQNDIRFGKLITILAVLSLVVACIGLLGLATFTMEQKLYEIGIRKAMGATIANIVSLFSWQFGKLLLLSTIIFIPLSLVLTDQILKGYPAKVALTWHLFLLPALLLLLVAMGSIIIQILKGAYTNPARILRSE